VGALMLRGLIASPTYPACRCPTKEPQRDSYVIPILRRESSYPSHAAYSSQFAGDLQPCDSALVSRGCLESSGPSRAMIGRCGVICVFHRFFLLQMSKRGSGTDLVLLSYR
jgi:hypothetical protein